MTVVEQATQPAITKPLTPVQNPPKVKRKVRRGIAFLDKHAPGWYRHVNPAKLDIYSHEHCVLGQVFGRSSFYPSDEPWVTFSYRHGFLGLDALEEQWRDYIIYRRMVD